MVNDDSACAYQKINFRDKRMTSIIFSETFPEFLISKKFESGRNEMMLENER